MAKPDISTWIGYTYAVSKNSEEPFIDISLEHEEYLVPVTDFISDMEDFDPKLCKALLDSPVTDVLILRGW